MADKVVSVVFSQVDLDCVRSGLELARASASRLSARGGQPTDIAEAYKRRVSEVTSLLIRMPVKVPA